MRRDFYFHQNQFMKLLTLLICSLIAISVNAQTNTFPKNWEGNWKGDLSWYKTGNNEPTIVNMELRIHPTDSTDTWTWQIIYGSETEDNRPYKLVKKDTSGVHWAIDENNGIILDQYWVANKFSGAFTVISSTIINNYWLEDGKLLVEFYTLIAKPVSTTGFSTEDSPKVDSYKISGYQKAVLKRVQ